MCSGSRWEGSTGNASRFASSRGASVRRRPSSPPKVDSPRSDWVWVCGDSGAPASFLPRSPSSPNDIDPTSPSTATSHASLSLCVQRGPGRPPDRLDVAAALQVEDSRAGTSARLVCGDGRTYNGRCCQDNEKATRRITCLSALYPYLIKCCEDTSPSLPPTYCNRA